MEGWLSGPVAITGAGGHVGTFLQRRLEELPNEVRPLGRDDDAPAAFRDAAAVIHLAGTLQAVAGNTYQEANVETAERTLWALDGSSVARLVLLSYVGADPGSRNEYLRTKGVAEALLRGSGREVVILRSTFIYGPPERPGPSAAPFISEGKPVAVIGTGRQRYAPVFVGDVVEALVRAALDPRIPAGTFALAGPEVLTVNEFVEALNTTQVRARHLRAVVAHVLAHVVPSLTPAMVEVLAADSLPDRPLIADAFGLNLHAIGDVYGPPNKEAR